MNFAFFGSPEFAAIILEKLLASNFIPKAVVTSPDRPVGRKKILASPPAKLLAQKHKIPILQPEKLEIGNWKLEIQKIKTGVSFDFFVVVAYAKILPQELIELPRLGTIGVHPSLLPKYRGATPIQTAILDGAEETGVTLFLLDEKVDHGPILAQANLQINGRDYKELEKALAELSAELLIKTLPRFLKGEVKPKAQDESLASFTKKITTEDAYIHSADLKIAQDRGGKEAIMIARKIRAYIQEPGAWTVIQGIRTKLLKAKILDGRLILETIQKEGKKPEKVPLGFIG